MGAELIGVDVTKVRTSAEGAEFLVGTRARTTDTEGTKEYVYVQDSGAGITGAGYVALISSVHTAIMATTTTSAPGAGAGKGAGVAMAAVAASGYGWLQVLGNAGIRVLASAALGTLLNTTATAGALDDDATAGAEVIDGITLNAANGGSAGSVVGLLTYPTVGRTL